MNLLSSIAKRTEDRIAKGVQANIAIRMCGKAVRARYINTADARQARAI